MKDSFLPKSSSIPHFVGAEGEFFIFSPAADHLQVRLNL